MKLETFFEQFDQFADAPDAVAKMRELVLEWAITGKLCHTNFAEWSEGVLGDVIELISGQHLLGHEHNEEGRGIPYLTGPSDFGEKNPIPTRWTEQPKITAKPGDILITVKGSGVGKTNVLVDQPTAISRQLMAIRVTGAEPEFVHFVLKRAAEHFQNAKTGIAIPGIGRREVLGLKVVLPPLAMQKQIVAKVDELMALCDRLEAQQQEQEPRHAALARASLARFADAPTLANLDLLFHKSYSIPATDLRKSILTLAVQGKLVPQDANDEPAEVRLLPPVTRPKGEQETPFELPDSWRWIQLGQVSDLINGDRSKNYPNKAEYVQEGVAWINTGHIEPDGTLSTDSMHYITREKFDSLRSGKVRPGDLVYCLRGATLGKTAIITQFEEGAVASSLVIIRLSSLVDPKFAYHFLMSPLGRDQIYEFDNGSAQPNLSANNVRKYWVPLPPLAEQRRIVAKVEQLMALVDELETQLATARTTAEQLLEAVVVELTTQD
ncbi:MAG: restriction endonuclease subunit S [Nitrospiraceae bacterium]|nr:restriction endonuclease subunit S [Nitrospiraceae bacterium]